MLILRSPAPASNPPAPPRTGWSSSAYPDKPWKECRSPRMLAEAWQEPAPSLPPEMMAAFVSKPFERFTPILVVPEFAAAMSSGAP